MKLNPKTLVSVQMFKTAFMVVEAGNCTRLANNMVVSLRSGYRGYRAVGKERKGADALYTLESLFEVSRLMGESQFEGGVLPDINSRLEPREEVLLREFYAILFLNGNKVAEMESTSKEYKRFHNAMKYCHVSRKDGRLRIYRYSELARVAERFGWHVPPLACVTADARANEPHADIQAELPLTEQAEQDGKVRQETRTFRARLLANQEEIISLLRELLATWKGDAR